MSILKMSSSLCLLFPSLCYLFLAFLFLSVKNRATAPVEMDVKIKGAHLVGRWLWDCRNDTCGICRQHFEACCPQCRFPGDDCPILTGRCTHTFHIHCIERWAEREQGNAACPMCRQPWEF
ncbi:anaphase promoting complex subunit protein [Trypanosoma cruzi]|nr:anaphase promoting complex subunit protein [Trypanosoma cruzi]